MYKIRPIVNLIFILLFLFILVDLEVAQLIALLGVGHNAQPVTEIVLLQVLLGQIFQVSAKQWKMCQIQSKMNHWSFTV